MMKSLEHYKNTFLASAEAGLIDYKSGSEEIMGLFRKTVSPDTGRADRIIAVFKLIKEFLP